MSKRKSKAPAKAKAKETVKKITANKTAKGSLKPAPKAKASPKAAPKAKAIKYKGKTYRSQVELANDLGIKKTTLTSRLRKGMTLKQAIEFKPKSSFKYKGKTYLSRAELLKEVLPGVKYKQFAQQLEKSGGSIAKTVSHLLKSKAA